MHSPLISCVCVTKEELALPVHCFWQQSYDNLELVVVHEKEQWPELDAVIKEDPRIRSVYVPLAPKRTLGALYNIGVYAGSGQYFAVWDSDDWSAPTRIRAQYEHMIGERKQACVLERWTIFDRVTKRAKISKVRMWEGSLLMAVNIFPRYPEDVPFSFDTEMVKKLSSKRFAKLDAPEQLIYVLHSANVNGRAHAEHLFENSGNDCKPYEIEAFEERFRDAEADFEDFLNTTAALPTSVVSNEERSF